MDLYQLKGCLMPILTVCTLCSGQKTTNAYRDGQWKLVECWRCNGTGQVKPYRRALTISEWPEEWGPINSWPRYGREKHCAVCDKPLTGRQRSFCGDRVCRHKLWQRLYESVHWQKRHVIVRDGCACRGCGETFESSLIEGGPLFPEPWRLELDHIQPLHLGGDDHPDNLQLLCPDCHKLKTAREAPVHADRRRGQRRMFEEAAS